MLNSEIRKYYWQDFSLQRTIAMPVVLGIIVLIIALGNSKEQEMVQAITTFAATAYFIIVFLWGGHRAATSVIDEVNEHTWDSQRLSPVSPLSITFGKLLGSTLYTWYGGIITLVIYALYSLYYNEPYDVVFYVVLFLFSGIFCQTVSLLTSLESIRTRTYHRRVHAFAFLIAGIIAANLFFSFGNIPSIKVVRWFGTEYNYRSFLLSSLMIFLAWSVIGIYRQMREELKFRNIPWVWGLFIIFLMVYAKGFVHLEDYRIQEHLSPVRPWSGIAFVIGILSTYLMLFVDKINITRYRMIGNNIKKKYWIKIGESTPRWIISFLLTVIAGIVFAGSAQKAEDINILFVMSTILFIMRDGCILHYFQFSPTPRRASLATMFYLAVLYLLIPALLYAANAKETASYFFPIMKTEGVLDNILMVLAQVFLTIALLYSRWKKVNRVIE